MNTKWLLLALLLPVVALRAEDRFATSFVTNGITLELKTTARMKMGGVVSMYDAALYLPADVGPDKALDDVPRRLELVYLKTISSNVLIKSANEGLEKGETPANRERLKERIDKLNAAYESVKPRDRYALTYIPSKGTELSLNGVSKAKVPGADLATAYFGIWLGPNCARPEVRDELLGRKKR